MLRKVTISKAPPGAVVDPVNDYPLLLPLDAKDNPMREINEMADFEGERSLLRDDRTAFRQVFQRIDSLNQPAKPPFRGFRLFSDVTDETNVVPVSTTAGSVMST